MKRTFAFFAALILLAGGAGAQDHSSVAVLYSSDIEPYRQAVDGFSQSLVQNGLLPDLSTFNLKLGDPAALQAGLLAKHPAMVLAVGTPALKFASDHFKSLPIVYCMVLNPEAVARDNTTGVSMNIPPALRLKKIKQLLPHARRIGIVYSEESAGQVKPVIEAASAMGMEIISKKIASEKDFPDTVKDLAWRIDAFLMVPDSKVYFPKSTEYLLTESLKNKFPVIGLSSIYTKAGALFSFDCDYKDLGQQAGDLARQILKGEKPESLEPAVPRKARLSLNLLTAERLGIIIPADRAREATELFEK